MSRFARSVSAVILVSVVLAGSSVWAAWIYTPDNLNRYDPATRIAEYNSGGTWLSDPYFSSNPAYVLFLATGGSSSSVCSETISILNNYARALDSATFAGDPVVRALMRQFLYAASMSVLSPRLVGSPGPTYQDSALSEWDWRTGIIGGYGRTDLEINAAGARFDARTRSLKLSLDGQNGRFQLLNSLRFDRLDGKDAFSGTDSELFGLQLVPAYSILQQDSHAVDLVGYAGLDLAYVETDGMDSQFRVAPSIGAAIGRATPIGYFLGGYTFTHSRNTGGDQEASGSHYMNIHAGSLTYGVPITEKVHATAGVDYTYAEGTPTGMENELTTARVGLNLLEVGRFDMALSYYQAIDGRDTRGGEISAGCRW